MNDAKSTTPFKDAPDLFEKLIQIGVITKDLDNYLAQMKFLLGKEHSRIAEYPPRDEPHCERIYRGKNGDFRAKFCFFDFGCIEFEVIQPIEGANIWDEFLDQNGGSGLHHLKYLVKDHDAVRAYFADRGIEPIQSGASVGINKGKTWVFYDTYDKLGFYTEIMNELPKKEQNE